jgi:hypothetical protein
MNTEWEDFLNNNEKGKAVTTSQQLDDLTFTMGEALREAWMKGYAEAIRQITEQIKDRMTYSSESSQQGLLIALAIIKDEAL